MVPASWLVTELVAKTLELDIDADTRNRARRGLVMPRDGTATLGVADVVDAGALLNLAYTRRQVASSAFAELLRSTGFPVVEVAQDEVRVYKARHGRTVHGVAVTPDGAERPFEVAIADIEHANGALRELLFPVDPRSAVGRDPVHGTDEHPHPTPVQRLWQLVVQERRDIGLVYLYATLVGLLSLTLPLGVQAIIGQVSGGLILQPVVLLIGFVIAGTAASGALQVMQLSVVEVIQQRIFARMAFDFGRKVPRLKLERLTGEHLPELMNRFFETLTIQKSLSKLLTETTTALLQALFGLILLTFYHPYFTLFALFLVAGLWLIFRITGRKGLETSLVESKYKYKAVNWLEEMARSITAFKFAGPSDLAVRRMDEHVTGYLKYRKKHFSVLVTQSVSIVVFKTLITGGLLILGSTLVINRQISLGQFVASEIIIVTVLGALEKMIVSISTVYDILTAVEKAGHVADLPVERAGGLRLPAPDSRGVAVTATDLTFRYPDAKSNVIEDISLALAAGERVALVGPDGSGQSTLARVMTGLYDGYIGVVRYDGLTLRDLDHVALRDRIGQLLSSTDLFDGTIEENIAVGRAHIRTAEVMRALEQVGLHDYVQSLPEGLRTRIIAGGRSLPAAITHKLLLAQAIAGSPAFLVLEDLFRNLDVADRRAVIDMLTAREQGWTMLAITHDPAFMARCDRVVLLEQGRVVGQGTFAELRDHPYLAALLAPAGLAA